MAVARAIISRGLWLHASRGHHRKVHQFRLLRWPLAHIDSGYSIRVLAFAEMTTTEEPEPLELRHIRKVPNADLLGCCALFRKFEEADVPGAVPGWTCLGIPKTPYGQALSQVMQNEVGSMRLTRATHFLVFPCTSEIELAAVHKGLRQRFKPLFEVWPPTSPA